MNRKFIARQLILEAKRLLAAGKDDSDYVYDPDHKHKPKGGHWEKTEKGWSQKKEEKNQNLSNLSHKQLSETIANKDTSSDVLEEISKRNYPVTLRRLIPKHPNVSSDTLKKLSKDKDDRIRENVASNSNTPKETLYELSSDKNEVVRTRVAGNINTPIETLKKLSEDEGNYREIQYAVGRNPNTPIETLEKLSDQENPYDKPRRGVAENPNTPTDILSRLSKDPVDGVRCSVASNRKTSPEILEKLASDNYYAVRRNVASNPETPNKTLQKLLKDKDKDVVFEAIKNVDYSDDLINMSNYSPEFIEQLNGMEPEDFKKFIGWLRERKG